MGLTKHVQPIVTWLTLGSWATWAVGLTGITGAVVMSALSAQMIWFWGAWGIFGVISVGLVTWTLITATLVLYRGAIGTWRSRVGAIFIGLAAVMFLIGIILVAKDRKLIEGTPTPADPTASAATPVSRITEESKDAYS